MIGILIPLILIGASAECVDSSRNEPVVFIKDKGQSHFVHLLEGETKECERLAHGFNYNSLNNVCGCKKIVAWGERDRVRLRCATKLSDGNIVSSTVAIYYYYDDDISIPACKRLAGILMKKRNP